MDVLAEAVSEVEPVAVAEEVAVEVNPLVTEADGEGEEETDGDTLPELVEEDVSVAVLEGEAVGVNPIVTELEEEPVFEDV